MSDTIDTDTAGWEADSPADAPAAPSPAQMPQHRPQAAQGDGGGQDDEPDRLADDAEVDMQFVRKLRSEAKGLRTRAQIAEDERDGLRTVVDGLRKAEVERLAATELRDARDLLDRHPDVAEFIDEHGHVDAERVIAAGPRNRRRPPALRPRSGRHGTADRSACRGFAQRCLPRLQDRVAGLGGRYPPDHRRRMSHKTVGV